MPCTENHRTNGGRGTHWENTWAVGWFLILSSSLALPVGAMTIGYDAVVTSADGPHSAVFTEGETLGISYTLDPLVVDSNGDPQQGIFGSAVLSLSVSFPTIGVSAIAGPAGAAQTFDNVLDAPTGTLSDQVFFFGGPISSTSLLGGEPISAIGVDFLSDFVAPPAEPIILASDALPLFSLPIIDAFVELNTASGVTYVHFGATTGEATPSNTPTASATPTPTPTSSPTNSPTVTPKPSTGGDGCAIDSRDHTVLGNAWLILLPALLLGDRSAKLRARPELGRTSRSRRRRKARRA